MGPGPAPAEACCLPPAAFRADSKNAKLSRASRGPADQAEALGIRLAEDLLSRGADVILKEVYAQA